MVDIDLICWNKSCVFFDQEHAGNCMPCSEGEEPNIFIGCDQMMLVEIQPPTSEPPKEPGWYDLTIRVRIDQSGDKEFGMLLVEFPQSVSYVDVLDVKGQWSGPLKEPA